MLFDVLFRFFTKPKKVNMSNIYFTLKELNPNDYPLSPEVEENLNELIVRISAIREAYGKPMKVNSGLRSEADQQRINPSAPKSKHLTGNAVDIADASGELYDFCKANEQLLADNKLWCEERQGGWLHFQSLPPKSGKRWFLP